MQASSSTQVVRFTQTRIRDKHTYANSRHACSFLPGSWYEGVSREIAVEKPFSQACENNKRPILEVLRRHLGGVRRLVEIGSGTGQHAAYFAAQLPHLVWQPSDVAENLAGIRLWVEDAALDNLPPPVELDVTVQPWPVAAAEAIFSANTMHIMSWPAVTAFLTTAAAILKEDGGLLCLYGPFNYNGTYTSDSNRRFDAWLRQRDRDSGIRDFEAIDALAAAGGLRLIEDNAMPANNRLLVWRKH